MIILDQVLAFGTSPGSDALLVRSHVLDQKEPHVLGNKRPVLLPGEVPDLEETHLYGL